MKILHFSHCDLGSTQASTAHVMEFAEGLARRGHRVRVVTPKRGKGYANSTSCEMYYYPILPIKGLRQLSMVLSGFFTLLWLKWRWQPDCLYFRRVPLDPMPGVFAWLTRVPLVTEITGQVEIHEYEVPVHILWKWFWYPFFLILERILFANSKVVTAEGERTLIIFRRRYPAWSGRFYLVPGGGIDLDRFRPVEKREARKELGLPLDRRFLVWVGTIFAWSGLEILLEAATRICAERPDVDLLIIGDGSDRTRFMRMAAEKGLSERIRFTGYIPNAELFRWLSASDLALAPYTRLRLDREDFTSYKLFEYLACGLPVICSYEKGNSNINYVSDYNLGATVPPEDADEFATAVFRILGDASYFSTDFAERARTILRQSDMTWDAVVDQVEALCLSAEAESRRGTKESQELAGLSKRNDHK
jgi:glycosyltransferase involved in cell wall biosynthesis